MRRAFSRPLHRPRFLDGTTLAASAFGNGENAGCRWIDSTRRARFRQLGVVRRIAEADRVSERGPQQQRRPRFDLSVKCGALKPLDIFAAVPETHSAPD